MRRKIVFFSLSVFLARGVPQAASLMPSELRLGVLAHDVEFFTDHEENGTDVNVELLWRRFGTLWGMDLRPHLGASLELSGNTSHAYFGLSATTAFMAKGFFEFSLGGAAHDGHINGERPDRKDLGCRLLFRESVSLGFTFGEHSSLSVMGDHISNANLCSINQGLSTVGLRYGYRF